MRLPMPKSSIVMAVVSGAAVAACGSAENYPWGTSPDIGQAADLGQGDAGPAEGVSPGSTSGGTTNDAGPADPGNGSRGGLGSSSGNGGGVGPGGGTSSGSGGSGLRGSGSSSSSGVGAGSGTSSGGGGIGLDGGMSSGSGSSSGAGPSGSSSGGPDDGGATCPSAAGTAPTWSSIWSTDGFSAVCKTCHTQPSSATAAYTWLKGKGYINGKASTLVKVGTSPLSLFGGSMPPGFGVLNAAAKCALLEWVSAGALNN